MQNVTSSTFAAAIWVVLCLLFIPLNKVHILQIFDYVWLCYWHVCFILYLDICSVVPAFVETDKNWLHYSGIIYWMFFITVKFALMITVVGSVDLLHS